jgi:hypothetical protein
VSTELQDYLGLQEKLFSADLDPQVLVDFRDAVSRVRNSAWAAQQYVAGKEGDQDSTSLVSFFVRRTHSCRLPTLPNISEA